MKKEEKEEKSIRNAHMVIVLPKNPTRTSYEIFCTEEPTQHDEAMLFWLDKYALDSSTLMEQKQLWATFCSVIGFCGFEKVQYEEWYKRWNRLTGSIEPISADSFSNWRRFNSPNVYDLGPAIVHIVDLFEEKEEQEDKKK